MPPASSQTSLEIPFPHAISKCLLKTPLPNLATSTVLGTTTTHKNNRFRGDYCPTWELQLLPTTLTHITRRGAGGSSFLRPPARAVPNFWLNINKFAQCKTIPVPLHSLTCQVSDSLCAFCFHASVHGISFWPPKTHPLSMSHPSGACGADPGHCALFHGFTCEEQPCRANFPFKAAIWVHFVLSQCCIFWWTFYRYGLYLWEGRSRSAFHMQCYNMLQWSWFLEHSSPLKCQINP